MTKSTLNVDRRTLIRGAAAAGALQISSPAIIAARGETPVRIGMVDPLTGVYAAPAGNEVMGAKLAIQQTNANGGMEASLAQRKLQTEKANARTSLLIFRTEFTPSLLFPYEATQSTKLVSEIPR